MDDFLRFDWLIKQSHLAPLGITDQHLHFFFGLILMVLFYNLIRPIVYWMILLKWDRMVSYLISGLMVLFVLVFYEVYQGASGTGNVEVRDVTSGSLALIGFGIVLAIAFAIERIVAYVRQQKKQKPKSV